MISQNLLDKIKKLLERTEANGCTPAEAAAASAKVAILLAQHNLSMSDISDDCVDDLKIEDVEVNTGNKSASVYSTEIASALEPHFGVKVYLRKIVGTTSVTKLYVYGESIKVKAFSETFAFVLKCFKKYWTDYHTRTNFDTEYKNRIRLAYLKGFLEGITNEMIRQENEFAVVPVKSQKVQEFENSFTRVHTFNVHAMQSAEAKMKGYQDGSYAQRARNQAIA